MVKSFFDKGAKINGKNCLSKKQCRNVSYHVRIRVGPWLTPHAKINSKPIRDLNVRPNTTEKKTREATFMTLGLKMLSWIWHQRTNARKKKISKLDFMKIRRAFFWSSIRLCGILVPWLGPGPWPQQWEHSVLTTGLPWNSLTKIF